MADPFGDVLQQFQMLMTQIEGVQTMRQNVRAADEFARAAMAVLLTSVETAQLHQGMIEAVAETAWKIADAMVVERTRRFGIDDVAESNGHGRD